MRWASTFFQARVSFRNETSALNMAQQFHGALHMGERVTIAIDPCGFLAKRRTGMVNMDTDNIKSRFLVLVCNCFVGTVNTKQTLYASVSETISSMLRTPFILHILDAVAAQQLLMIYI